MPVIARMRELFQLLLHRNDKEAELNTEIRTYFEMHVERQMQRGMSVEEARRWVRLNLEGSEQVKERVREVRAGAGIISFLRDLKHGLRTLRKNRLFAGVTILTLGLGIGATTAIFSVVYAVLLKPLPYYDANRLILLFETGPQDSRQPFLLSDLEILKSHSAGFSDVAVYYKDTGFSRVTLTGIAEPQSAQGDYVTSNLFPLLGIAPTRGRAFTADEEVRGERLVLLSYKLCLQRFGSIATAIGKGVEIDGAPFQVIGVMPADFQFPAADIEFWVPITTNRYWLERPVRGTNGRGFYARWNALARLKHGVSFQAAQRELNVLAPQLDRTNPDMNRGLGLAAVPLHIEVNGNSRLALLMLLSAVSILLIIACVNAALMMLAHGANRGQEIAIRVSLGARRRDVLRQLLTESLIIALFAGLCGVILAAVGLHALLAFAPNNVPRLDQASISVEVLYFAIGVSFLTAILSGFFPAWKFSRATSNDALKSSGRTSSANAGLGRVRACLVTAEFALTVVLLIGAGLLIRSFLAVEAVDPGFSPEHTLTARARLSSQTQYRLFYEDALARIAAVPGVRFAGAISGLFEEGATYGGSAAEGDPQQKMAGACAFGRTGQAFGATIFKQWESRCCAGAISTNKTTQARLWSQLSTKVWHAAIGLAKTRWANSFEAMTHVAGTMTR